MGGLSETFDKSRLTTTASRIADVAKDHTYTIIGDIDHTKAAPYELIAKPETMHALASAGVKHIATEMFMPADQKVLDAYADGKISDKTMRYVIQKMGSPSLARTGLDLDDTYQNNAYFSMIYNAKKAGIEVHGVNGSEGVVPPEQIGPLNELLGDMKFTMAMAIEKNPKFFEMKRLDQGNFMTKQLYDSGFNDAQVRLGLEITGFREQSFVDLNDESGMRELIINRLMADPDVAQRIKDVTGGEKSVVIYGQVHMLRPTGDIDASLPNSAVIDVFTDQKEYNRTHLPLQQKAAQELGMDFSDRADYQLDIKTGKWTNTATNEVANVAIPNLPSVGIIGQGEPGLTTTMPPPRPYDLPDIKF